MGKKTSRRNDDLSVTKTRPTRSTCWGRSFKPFVSRISHDLTCPRILPFVLISYVLIVLVVNWNKNMVSFCYNGLDSTSFSTLVLKDRPPSWQKKSARALRPFSFLHCRKTSYWWGHAFTHSFIQVKCSSRSSLKITQLCQSWTEIDWALWAEFCPAKVETYKWEMWFSALCLGNFSLLMNLEVFLQIGHRPTDQISERDWVRISEERWVRGGKERETKEYLRRFTREFCDERKDRDKTHCVRLTRSRDQCTYNLDSLHRGKKRG